ncbi:mannitol dehydrogenase family protein [Jeotgalibaca ciconiae]|uniref:Mannitol dehydrogenase family protein n=1 Tax=Jeotgalibaca ciconiae TaxID=2496265 RepID=A0A3S9H8C5_9LACT|nr:mannitol dehydrogenase family protein [Jeotgalibaca ciconiae]AZP03605.1 mannitol dehydrogenase family protein [Jeotgalibaca ciconiae]
MELNKNILKEKNRLIESGFNVPEFDYEEVKKRTMKKPKWIHFGAGNIFRAFLAPAQQELLNKGIDDTGIVMVEGYDYEIVDVLQSFDDLTINVTLKSNGDVNYDLVSSISAYLKMDTHSSDYQTLRELVQSPSLQLISFTITEKGYSLTNNNGDFYPHVLEDFKNGPKHAESYLGKLVSLLVERFDAGKLPLALVSMDNMSENGRKLEEAVLTIAEQWHKNDFVAKEFLEYLNDKNSVSFPWSMIDKITPRPDVQVQRMLEDIGFSNMSPQETERHTFVAPYVNGEETQYLIIEDLFPNGRPQLEETGIIFTNKETVNAVETMKVTTCLNPLHTALAIYGCLLGYTSIYQEMKDEDLVALIKLLGYDEGLPVVKDPKIIDPKEFIDEVINVRLSNPFIPDTPQRIASDTSQKLSVRFGETLKSYIQSEELDVTFLRAIPLVYAGWLRYLMAVDDNGEVFQLSPDPLLTELTPIFSNNELGEKVELDAIQKLLTNEKIFGIDLFKAGIGNEVLQLFEEMTSGPGAVRATIQKVLTNKK